MAYTPEIDLRDSLVGQNLIINGDMNIAQRGTSFSAPATSTYTLDRWRYEKNGAMVHTISQDSDVPTFDQSGQFFSNSFRMNLTTPDGSIAAGEYCHIQQTVEGYNFRKIAGKSFTISFWVKSTTTGIRTVAFRNSGVDRTYVAEYTIISPNTWEKKTINVLAPPSAGTWNYTNGSGLIVSFGLAAGSTLCTTKDIWQTGNYTGTLSQVNGVATGSTDFRITGVMLNEGTEALPFSLAGGNYAGELYLCQRYYETSYDVFTPLGSGVDTFYVAAHYWATNSLTANSIPFRVPKRRVPTGADFKFWNSTGTLGSLRLLANATNTNWSSPAIDIVTANCFSLAWSTTAPTATVNASGILRGSFSVETEL